ncbi:histidine kinase [Stanieria cyanosphaera PCC 7437]|uniref:histidine kinase n=1 Tax=Stanieria cyanosphaera (strain ATCC 29371 / PCC 7437) TaxID=111780 RepID=K9XSD7_STAC7|nr:HAMP domain-containing sensor histidine kinase [Stanieria cyanosphaera]AFZ35453.1 histidine kinase [Stanieria cyanosphaera PCC 7437]
MNEIDDLKEELKQTQLAYQMAAQMSQFKAGFLARTSHELRSPLSSLIGLHQLILSDLCDSPEEQKEFISQAYKSALKLMKLIDEIVSVAKTEYGTNQLHLESLQLAEVFHSVYNLTHLQAANRNLQLEIQPCDSSCYVLADRARLIQALVNLIDSGISLMNEGKITVVSNCEPKFNEIKLEINFDCPAQLWQKNNEINPAVNNLSRDEIKKLIQEINLSPGMRLLLSQTLVETMNGRLEFLDLSQEITQINLILSTTS